MSEYSWPGAAHGHDTASDDLVTVTLPPDPQFQQDLMNETPPEEMAQLPEVQDSAENMAAASKFAEADHATDHNPVYDASGLWPVLTWG